MLLFFKDEINLPLAIEDYVPVFIFAGGLFFVAKIVSANNQTAGKLAFIGGILVTLGGVFKASWKIIQAIGGADIPLLNNSLFVFMSAGFVCLAWAYLKRNSSESSFAKICFLPISVILIFWSISFYFGYFLESRAWFFILLGLTTVANLFLLSRLIYTSYSKNLRICIILFVINLICIFLLARFSDQTVTYQWIKQLINTLSQIAFAFASYYLYNNIREDLNKNG
jgi:hypothetical protein